MRSDTRYRGSSSLFSPSVPPGVKWLIAANVAIYLIDLFGSLLIDRPLLLSLNLMPFAVMHGSIWQLVTYMFLHSTGSPSHILFNMLALWMFGSAIEQTWGTRRFLQYYFICGVGAAVCVVLANIAFGNPYQLVIGASGAIYGLLLAFGMLFPEQEILVMFLFPMKAKYMVMIFGAIAFVSSFQTGGTVSNLAHLGGMLVGYIYIRSQFSRRAARVGPPGFGFARFDPGGWWRDYKMRRAKKKFQVYMNRRKSS